jgi:lipopolysaccharide export system protein LptA
MTIRHTRSIIIISLYTVANLAVIAASFQISKEHNAFEEKSAQGGQGETIIADLEYFHIKQGVPQLSLSANSMEAQGQETAVFDRPKGVYNYWQKNKTIRYEGDYGKYLKDNSMLLKGHVKIRTDDSEYYADIGEYFFNKDLFTGDGSVKFVGDDLKSKDHVEVYSDHLRANPEKKLGRFTGNVHGTLTRQKKYEGRTDFKSDWMFLDGVASLAKLEGNVWAKRGEQVITSRKGDFHLENYNKSLKYFVFNDDVKVTEKVKNLKGEITERKAFAERLEGFGREQKMVLSGAPRVETGSDVIKGYRITTRENVDLIEVDDAMSDVKVKKN